VNADGRHLGEDAELFALGVLSEDEALAVERHIEVCEACRTRTLEAAETVTSMIEADVAGEAAPRRRISLRALAAIAAALLLWFLPHSALVVQNRALDDAVRGQDAVTQALLHSHFSHVPMVADVPSAPAAKVLFSARAPWLYVIVASPRAGMQIGAERGGIIRILGRAIPQGRSSFFYTPSAPAFDRILLLEDGRTIAHATPRAATPAPR
jgi:hypothetical protein